MRNFILKILVNIYERIFQEKIPPGIQLFFKNLEYVIIGLGIAAILNLIFQVLAGRILGPSEYGKYALVQSVAMFLYVPMVLGINTAMVKYNAEKDDYERQCKIISASYLMIFILSLISALVLFLFSPQLSKIFAVSSTIFYLAIIFAFFYVLYSLTTNTLRGLHEMKKLSVFRAGYSLGVLIMFGLFIFFAKFISFQAAVFSIIIAYLIIFLLITISLRKYLVFHFDMSWMNRLIKYGLYVMIGGIAAAFYLNFDKIIINKYLTAEGVGIYRVYYASFITLIVLFSGMFTTVFFPVASRYQNKEKIFRKINKLIPYLITLSLPLIVFFGFLIFKLYGSSYIFNFKLGMLFGFAGIFMVLSNVYGSLMSAIGRKGVKVATFAAIILALLNVFLNILLVPRIGISGAVIALIISYGVFLGIILSKRNYYKLEMRPYE